MKHLVLGLLLLAAPALAQQEGGRDDFAAWAKEQIAKLEQQVEGLKERVAAMSEQAKPVVRDMRDKVEEEKPKLEAAGRSFWEKLKAFAAAVGDDFRDIFGAADRS
jgi:phage shock protein A